MVSDKAKRWKQTNEDRTDKRSTARPQWHPEAAKAVAGEAVLVKGLRKSKGGRKGKALRISWWVRCIKSGRIRNYQNVRLGQMGRWNCH